MELLFILTANMKTQITKAFVNLQQGFILSEANIVGSYSHHHKAIAIKLPWHSNDFEWVGTEFENYIKVDGAVDSFSISCYGFKGEIDLSDLLLATM